jgi:hypothetical protein
VCSRTVKGTSNIECPCSICEEDDDTLVSSVRGYAKSTEGSSQEPLFIAGATTRDQSGENAKQGTGVGRKIGIDVVAIVK